MIAVLAWLALVAQLGLLGWQLVDGRPTRDVLLWAASGPVPTLLLAVLATVLGRRPSQPAAPEPEESPEQDGDQVAEGAAGELVAPERQPSWAPSEASGAVWSTAGDAARGAEADRWGAPGSGRAWGLPVDADEGPERRQDDPRH
ncbi:hypothetical protein [Auraticoccus monumenti]|uniref:hypothetical protein n=1 Tax=Auraticoccus monumenti TaxID=675864 RepID=UPI0012FB1AE6|nr:hypothetical protein [Auraticoccus monumenti]